MQEGDGSNASYNAIDLDLNEAGEEPEVLARPREVAVSDVSDESCGLDLNQGIPSPPPPKIEIKTESADEPPAVPDNASPIPGQADADSEERRLRELLLGSVKQEQAVPKQEEEKRAKSRSHSHSRSADTRAQDRDQDEKKKERKRRRSRSRERSRSRSRSRDRKHRRSSRREAKGSDDDDDDSRSERRRSRGKHEREDSTRSRKRSRSREERKKRERSRSRERSKRERRSRSRERKRDEKKKRERSRSREKKREKKKRERSRSRERSRDRRERKRSRRSRSRSHERSKSRERSRDRRRSRSRERVKRWDVKKEDEWVEKQPTMPAAAGSAAPVVGPAMLPTQLLLARLAGYPSAGLTYPGGPANPLPAPPPPPAAAEARPAPPPAHVDPEEERRRKLQALAGYGQDRSTTLHEMDARMPMGLGFKPGKHGPVVSQPIAPGMSVSVPIGKKNVVFKGWKKGETVTQDDIKRDTSGSSTSLRSLSDNTKSTVQVHEHHFNDHKITGGVGFKMLQKMGWGGDALGKHEDGIVEPIAITMNPGTRGLCGADEKAQGKKKKKKGGLRGPTDEPSNNPNYNYVKCRFDPNHVVPEHRLAKHELNCPANPNPASHKAQLKRQNFLANSSSTVATGHKKQRQAYDQYRPPPAHTPGVGPAPAFAYGHSLPPTPVPTATAAAAAAYQQQQYAMWAAYQQQQQAYGWPGAPTPRM